MKLRGAFEFAEVCSRGEGLLRVARPTVPCGCQRDVGIQGSRPEADLLEETILFYLPALDPYMQKITERVK
jgi:hypothetical protein